MLDVRARVVVVQPLLGFVRELGHVQGKRKVFLLVILQVQAVVPAR